MIFKAALITSVLVAALVLGVQPVSAMYTNPIVGARPPEKHAVRSSQNVAPARNEQPVKRRDASSSGSQLAIGLGLGLLLGTGSTFAVRIERRRHLARG